LKAKPQEEEVERQQLLMYPSAQRIVWSSTTPRREPSGGVTGVDFTKVIVTFGFVEQADRKRAAVTSLMRVM
jgi:hypothetical protein